MRATNQREREQATLSVSEYSRLAAERATVESLLEMLPSPSVIDRMSLQSRIAVIDKQLAASKYRTASHLRFNLPPVVTAGDSL